MIGTSFAGFAGTENNEENQALNVAAVYEFSRTDTGWITEPLMPPGTEVSHSNFLAAASDMSATLWDHIIQTEPEEEHLGTQTPYELVLRRASAQSGRGQLEDIGPEDSPQDLTNRNFVLAGASADLSHVLFYIKAGANETWPGDQSYNRARSLYSYSGTDNSEPELVAVKNGPLHGEPHLNEGAELISQCGAELGSGGAVSTYNAIAAQGKIIFFTALHKDGSTGQTCATPAVNELYARVDGGPVIPISGFKSPECTGACASAPKAAATFVGASEDGSKVFFMTEQKLLNGDSDTKSDLYEADLEGGAVTALIQISHNNVSSQAAEVQGVCRVSENGERVYFVAKGVLTTVTNDREESAKAGSNNLYLYEQGSPQSGGPQLRFIAALASNDKEVWSSRDLRPVQATPEGELLIFPSYAHLTSDDTSTTRQLFMYDALAHALTRVSIGQASAAYPGGYNNDGNIENSELVPAIIEPDFRQGLPTAEASGRSISDQGVVVFASEDALTPDAVMGADNVFEYEDGNVYLLQTGASPQFDFVANINTRDSVLGIDSRGENIFVDTTKRDIAEEAGGTEANIYDIRENGGFPMPAHSVECGGIDCQATVGPPSFSAPLSMMVPGAATITAPIAAKTKAKHLTWAVSECSRQLGVL